jgi:hypothetical protein
MSRREYEIPSFSGGFHDLRGPGGWNAPPTEKRCVRCEQWLPLDQFRLNPRMRSGLDSWCNGCKLERTRQYRVEHPEYEQAYNERRRAAYPAKRRRPNYPANRRSPSRSEAQAG